MINGKDEIGAKIIQKDDGDGGASLERLAYGQAPLRGWEGMRPGESRSDG